MMEFLTRQFQGSVLRKWKGKLKELYRQPPKLYYPFCHNLLVKASHETNVQVRDGKIDFTPWWKETEVMFQRCRQTGTEWACVYLQGEKSNLYDKDSQNFIFCPHILFRIRLIYLTANLTSNGCLKWTCPKRNPSSFLLWKMWFNTPRSLSQLIANPSLYCPGKIHDVTFASFQFSCSVTSDSLWIHGLDTPDLPVHHQLPGFTQTHVHWVSDAIQPSHPLSSPSPPTFNLSQH